jgi:hypothetical protein
MTIFKTKRERDLEELINLYRGKIEKIKNDNEKLEHKFIPIAVPRETDQRAYWEKITQLITDPLFVFYLNQLRFDIITEFEGNGKDNAEYYRGKLSAIGQIFMDARKAQKQLSGAKDLEI